jgi:alpha-L-fucosidase
MSGLQTTTRSGLALGLSAIAAASWTPLELTPHMNNQAFGLVPGESSFNTLNQSYPATLPQLNASATYTSRTGATYLAPGYKGSNISDNVICAGQTIALPDDGSYFAVSLLHSSDVRKKTVLGNFTFTYDDNTTSTAELRSEAWWSFLAINRGDIIYPSFHTANSTNWNTSHIFEFEAGLLPGKQLTAITLPNTTNTTTGRIHVFAISLLQIDQEKAIEGVEVQSVRPTQKWVGHDGRKSQVVELVVSNAGSKCIHGEGLHMSLKGEGVETVEAGSIKRLCPGDQKRATILVSGNCTASIDLAISYEGKTVSQSFDDVIFGLTNWTLDPANLARHDSPQWYDDAKFGIFIHWGPYSVPAWGNSTPYESYAEWFWWYTTHRVGDKSGFYDYRLRTFGPDLNYDDFFANFTAAAYEPKDWVDLIADAGAKYFVITTKHHDGFALFDAGNTTNRTSLHYGPKQDIVKSLFDAAETYQPSLKRGTYFSLPEWFNPSWGPYGFAQYDASRPDGTTHPGIIARNPYTNETEPYTGYIPVDDFIADVMVPQMNTLAYNYSSDIMWCDAGAANGTAAFAAQWWNWARENGRDVTINSRCGTAEVNDFDTPEYATFATPQRHKWESNQGMDPFSYGYNRATPASEYMNATTLITNLVDMVSKNGNLLLNIGPRADGSIPQVEIDNLREAGAWLKTNGEAIFNTTYWFRGAETTGKIGEVDVDVRFTQTEGAFYILVLPVGDDVVGLGDGTRLVLEAPLPLLEGDRIVKIGGEEEVGVAWDFDGQTSSVDVDIKSAEDLRSCWVLKVEYCA